MSLLSDRMFFLKLNEIKKHTESTKVQKKIEIKNKNIYIT